MGRLVRIRLTAPRHDVKDEFAGSAGGVDPIGERTQPDFALGQLRGEIDQTFHGAAEAIELPHHQHVAGTGM